jgi:hypothetical protein
MSQIVSETVETLEMPQVAFDPADEFAYRPVPPLAPISLFLGICAVSGFLGIPCLAIAVVGMLMGAIALWQIRRSCGEMGGKVVASLGVGLSVALFFAASGYHAYAYVTELPEGYVRVSFPELSKFQPIISEENGQQQVRFAPEVAALDGKPIYIKGYMFPTRQQFGISEFVLVKDTGQCCFGGQPKMTDMIIVRFENGMTVNHREQQLVGVGGVFRASVPSQSIAGAAIYTIEGTHFK